MDIKDFLGFVLGIACVLVLIMFGAKLYNHFVDAEMKNAKVFVDDLKGKIETLKDGESNSFALRGISNWVLVGWAKEIPIASNNEVVGKDRRPQKCLGINCLCLCEESVSKCQTNGYCAEIDRGVEVVSQLHYFDGYVDSDVSESMKDSFTSIPSFCIHGISSQLMSLEVSKGALKTTISYDYGYQQKYLPSRDSNKLLDELIKNVEYSEGVLEDPYLQPLRNRCGLVISNI